MANVDLNTGKIYGCREGSAVWWHEKGHIVFNNYDWGVRINYYQSFFLMLSVFFISLGMITNYLMFKSIGFVLSLAVICFYVLEESWCWIYSFRHNKSSSSSCSDISS